MDSFDDDIFALSDEDMPMLMPKSNPVEEHLMKQLSLVQNHIERANSDIVEIRDTTRRVLKSLHSQVQFGEIITSDSDSDSYTIHGQPLIKRKKWKEHGRAQILIVKDNWKRIVYDKWVIGITLENTSIETLRNVRFYVDAKDESEIRGISTLWCLEEEIFWCKTNTIVPRGKTIATVVLDLPKFERDSFADVYGTILYEVDEKRYQTPVPTVRLRPDETADARYGLTFSSDAERSILALKSVSVECVVGVQIETRPERGARLVAFFTEKSFEEVGGDVYVAKGAGTPTTYRLLEILPIVDGEARLRICCGSATQMSVMLRLLCDEFPGMTVKEDNNCIDAAMTLIRELELYLCDQSAPERQRARIKTDLLIP